MDLKSRVLAYCKIKNIAISKFESLAGLSNGYFNQVKRRPSKEKLDNIKSVFPDLNTNWLLTGEGEMLRENSPKTPDSASFPAGYSGSETLLMRIIEGKDAKIEELSRRIGELEAENRLLKERHFRDTDVSDVGSAVAG